MKRSLLFALSVAILLIIGISSQSHSFVLDWPEIFNPELLLTYNLDIDPDHWQEILYDMSPYDDSLPRIERPAYFWATGEENQKIYVEVRRKPGDPIYSRNNDGTFKISLKIDINEYYKDDHPDAVETWHGMKKFSLENGEGVAEFSGIVMLPLFGGSSSDSRYLTALKRSGPLWALLPGGPIASRPP